MVFVVDSADKDRFEDASEELLSILKEDQLRHSAILILANKQDSPMAASPAQIVAEFGLDRQRGR